MLKAEEIKQIELGPRQLFLFDLEDRTRALQEAVMSQLANRVEAHGETEALAFSTFAAEALGESACTVLQHLFWLAHDLKIQFTSDGRAISPDQAQSRLIHSSGKPIEVTLHPSVDAALLGRVRNLLDQIDPMVAGEAPRKEVELAQRLIRRLHVWKGRLEVCRTRARRKGFPGREEIDSALALLRTLSAKRDAASLIRACGEHAEALTQLDAEVNTLARFYDTHADQWRRLLQFARQATQTLDTVAADANIAAAYQRFKQIISHPRPYHRVEEACRLHRALKPCHERIAAAQTEKRRAEAHKQIKALIHEMKTHLDRHAADADTRNRSLYVLRQHLKAVVNAPDIRRLNRRMRSAEEDFEQLIDAVSDG
jgi:hypothetical protein